MAAEPPGPERNGPKSHSLVSQARKSPAFMEETLGHKHSFSATSNEP